MPSVGDIIVTRILQELDGVQVSNDMYWQIDDLGDEPSPAGGLVDVMNAYYDSCKAFMSDEWKIVCGIYENITSPEGKHIQFGTLVGLSATDSHPQDQVLRINSYGHNMPADKLRRNGFNQTGVIESLSTDGRINNMATVDPLRLFLTAQQIMPGPSWTLDPQVRWQTAPGPPATYDFANVTTSNYSTRFFKLSTRKTSLCATS